ncbi:MAG TPA: hypothetical protein VFF30_03125 [Nitrososphaerales archaeon]|nr:hypothetical protein [Nitrososphaerales archaeon]
MQAQIERRDEKKKLPGELLAVEDGKLAGIRILPDGKVEQSFQGRGKLLGMDTVSVYTAPSLVIAPLAIAKGFRAWYPKYAYDSSWGKQAMNRKC